MLTDTAAVTMGMNSAFALEMMTRCPSAEGATGASMDQVHVDQDSQWRDDKPINRALRRWVWNSHPELGQDMTSTMTGGMAWTAPRF